MKFTLYTGNHGDCRGIEEFITILSDLMARNQLSFAVNHSFCPDSTNIVIDEFTNLITVEELRAFREQHPKAPVVFLLTEFFHRHYGVESFNNFGDWRDQSVLAVFNLACKVKRPDLGNKTIADWLAAAVGAPYMTFRVMGHYLKKWVSIGKDLPSFMKKHYRGVYLHMRYLGLMKNIHLADAVLVSHPAIADQVKQRYPALPVLGCLYPEFGDFQFNDETFRSLDNYIEVTGTVTPFRHSVIHKINTDLKLLGIRSNIRGCFDQGFETASQKERRGAFSLHIPQSPQWLYSSPTRIFRALAKDQNVPVISHYFGQHPIEECALQLEGAKTYKMLSDFYRGKRSPASMLNDRIREYDELAIIANQQCVEGLMALTPKPIAFTAAQPLSALA